MLHGSAVTVLLDSVSGLAVVSALREPAPIATLDLRIDYLRAATPGRPILAEAHCFRVTRDVAFTRGFANQDDPQDPVAHATGSFILSRPGTSFAAPGPGRAP